MATKQIQMKQFLQRLEAGDPTLLDFSVGPSPGGAAAELGISRQAVHKAIKRGDLDAITIKRGDKITCYYVGRASLDRYKKFMQMRQRAAG